MTDGSQPGSPHSSGLKSQVIALALALGFDACRIADTDAAKREIVHLEQYLASGYHAQMQFLDRNPAARLDPSSLLPGCRSVIVTATSYYHPLPGWPTSNTANIARYAWGDEYHPEIQTRLAGLGQMLDGLVPDHRWKATVDTSPIQEKAFAEACGIGWRGKHSLILNEQLGSYFFIGLLLTTAELEPDEPLADGCLNCKLCSEACPSGAIDTPRVLNAGKCLSYLNTEAKTEDEPAADLHGWLFGCDACQLACPYNKAPLRSRIDEFKPRPGITSLTASDITAMNEVEFMRLFGGGSVERRGYSKLMQQANRLNNCND